MPNTSWLTTFLEELDFHKIGATMHRTTNMQHKICLRSPGAPLIKKVNARDIFTMSLTLTAKHSRNLLMIKQCSKCWMLVRYIGRMNSTSDILCWTMLPVLSKYWMPYLLVDMHIIEKSLQGNTFLSHNPI